MPRTSRVVLLPCDVVVVVVRVAQRGRLALEILVPLPAAGYSAVIKRYSRYAGYSAVLKRYWGYAGYSVILG
jgi:hypothetical protein